MAKKKASEVVPREVAGRDVILRFDYQFRRTAEACLQLLEDKNLERVFCDYHDDYVLKVWEGEDALFLFHQVKTKKKDSEQWTRKEVFGVGTKKAGQLIAGDGKGSIAGKLFYHHLEFGPNCRSVHIVTNAHFKEEIEEVITAAAAASTPKELSSSTKLSDLVLSFFATEFGATPDDVLTFFKKFELRADAGKLKDPNNDEHGLYLKRIYDYSEVELNQSQASRIAASLITLIKNKSVTEIPPNVSEQELEKFASVEQSDVIKVLSISQAAFDELKAGGDPKALRNASILQRLLKRSGANEDMIVSACRAKVAWDNWIRKHRHDISQADLMVLQLTVGNSLQQFVSGNLTVKNLAKQLQDTADEFQGKLPFGITLTSDLLFGLFWYLATVEEIF